MFSSPDSEEHWLSPVFRHYLANEELTEGFCYGFTYMAVQAILTNELDIFNQRLQIIRGTPAHELFQMVKNAQDKIARLAQEALAIEKSNEDLESQLSSDERLLLTIPAFVEGVNLYQNIFLYTHLFKTNRNIEVQNAINTAKLILPDQIQNQGGLRLQSFSGAHTMSDLVKYFDELSQALKSFNHPFAIVLGGAGHSFTVSLDSVSGNWSFTDANYGIPTKYFHRDDSISLALNAMVAFTANAKAVFDTTICTAGIYHDELNKCLANWKHNQSLVTKEKGQIIGPNGHTWLYLAAKNGEVDKVKELLHAGVDINKADNKYQYTPLHIAVLEGHIEIVKLLLETDGIDVNYLDSANLSPLHIAVVTGNIEMACLLLHANGLDPNEHDSDGRSLIQNVLVMENDDISIFLNKIAINKSLKNLNELLIEMDYSAGESRSTSDEDNEITQNNFDTAMDVTESKDDESSYHPDSEDEKLETALFIIDNLLKSSIFSPLSADTDTQTVKKCDNTLDDIYKQKK